MCNDAEDKPKDCTEDAGRVQNQAVFEVYHKDKPKVSQQNQSEKVSRLRRWVDPGINAQRCDDDLDDPKPRWARMSICAGTKEKVILPGEGSVAVGACGLAETPRDRQYICQVIHKPCDKPSQDNGYCQSYAIH
jgi:hypothetical protein